MPYEIVDPFVANGFTTRTVSKAILEMPLQFGRIQELGIFNPVPIRTRTVALQREAGALGLLPFREVGAPGTPGKTGTRDMVSLTVPHIPHDDFVHPEDVANLRDEDGELMALARYVSLKLQTMARKHDQTIEHIMASALQGLLVDADGSTVLNYFTLLGKVQQTVDFNMSSATANLRAKLLEAKTKVDEGMGGSVFTGYRILAGETWFRTFIDHGNISKRYENYASNVQLQRDPRAGFEFAGVVIEEYRAHAAKPDGTDRVFLPANEAVIFPTGSDVFELYMAPADMNEFVNTLGQRTYASIERARHGRGWDLHTQSNPMAVPKRPQCCVKLTMS